MTTKADLEQRICELEQENHDLKGVNEGLESELHTEDVPRDEITLDLAKAKERLSEFANRARYDQKIISTLQNQRNEAYNTIATYTVEIEELRAQVEVLSQSFEARNEPTF